MKARKAAMKVIKLQQKTLDSHLQEMPKHERVIAYSDLVFKRAAVEWLIATDQVSNNTTMCDLYDLYDVDCSQYGPSSILHSRT